MLAVSIAILISNTQRPVKSSIQHAAWDENIFVVFCQTETLLKLSLILELSVTVTLHLRKFPQDKWKTAGECPNII